MLLGNALDGSLANFSLQGLEFNRGGLDEGYYFEGAGKTGVGTDHSGIYVDISANTVWVQPDDRRRRRLVADREARARHRCHARPQRLRLHGGCSDAA
jgi:hypothetical protein